MAEPFGRDHELATVRAVLADERAVVVAGEPGIGKSTVWRASADAARAAGMHVLTASPASAERRLAFVALGDLLGAADLGDLAPPQRRALEVALLRADPGDAPPDTRGVGLACVALLVAHERLLIAIDDVQWLDAESAEVIAFAARRLAGTRFLLARRPGPPGPLEEAVAPRRIVLGPLSYGALRALLADRLGLAPPRRVLREVVASAGGNPLFALELARGLEAGGMPRPGERLALPETLDGMIGARVGQLPPAVRRLLLAVALEPGLRVAQALELVPGEALEDAAVDVAGDRVRAAHPLLAAAALGRSTPAERRALHEGLAALLGDPGRRARHRARAATAADPALAAELAAAAERRGGARRAGRRGDAGRRRAAPHALGARRSGPSGCSRSPSGSTRPATAAGPARCSSRSWRRSRPPGAPAPTCSSPTAPASATARSTSPTSMPRRRRRPASRRCRRRSPRRRAAAVAVGLVERLAEMEAERRSTRCRPRSRRAARPRRRCCRRSPGPARSAAAPSMTCSPSPAPRAARHLPLGRARRRRAVDLAWRARGGARCDRRARGARRDARRDLVDDLPPAAPLRARGARRRLARAPRSCCTSGRTTLIPRSSSAQRSSGCGR